MVQASFVALMFVIRRVHHIVYGLNDPQLCLRPDDDVHTTFTALSHSPAQPWQYDARVQAALLSI